ncbi:MAG: hypothetical protein OSA02_08450 [Schleiferiaceae bacterium]|nr:hypothetical protein [Schleiferiaceae bacterium]
MRLLLAFALSLSTFCLSAQVSCITTSDQLGPYFVSGTPLVSNDTLMPGVLDSNRALELTFYLTYDCDTIDLKNLPDEFQMELWHADSAGDYSNVDGNPNSFNYRARLNLTGESTTFHTELPGIYPWRPSHIHLKLYRHNSGVNDTIVSQLYFKGDSLLDFDGAINTPELWIALDTLSAGFKGSFALGVPALLGMEEGGLTQFSISPNPALNFVVIESPFAEQPVEVYGDLGQIIFEGVVSDGRLKLSCENWSSGLYVVRVGTQTKLLVIN